MRNRTISAEQAVSWGLASRIVRAERIREEALHTAQDIVAKKRGSLRHTKRLLSMACGNLPILLEAERSRFVQQITSAEARHGIVTFLEQRQAHSGTQREG